MYNDYFGLREAPFSIAPNPQYLFMSQRHREALAHLLYGIQSDGGFILLTGEVGTGKTTVCRCLLEQIPQDVDTAYILNPKQTAQEILATACDELHIDYPWSASIKVLVDHINDFLLASHQSGRRTVLIIDEAQNLSADVLEQLRLLTNLETNQRKLLQIILLGQPELLTLLAQQDLRQLSQRVTARFHLNALDKNEVADYIQHRLDTAGAKGSLFPAATVKRIYAISKGIPRLINLVCDRALLGTYVQGRLQVDVATVNKAAKEILGVNKKKGFLWQPIAAVLVIAVVSLWFLNFQQPTVSIIEPKPASNEAENQQSLTAGNELAALIATSKPEPKKTPIGTVRGYNEQFQAFGALMLMWGSDVVLAKNTDPCQVAAVSGLQCLLKIGSLRDFAHLNRPVVLNLSTTNTSQWFVVTGVGNDSVTVTTEGVEYILDAPEMLDHWSGFYTLLWRSPPSYRQAVKRGDSGAVVDLLLTRLAVLDGTTMPSIMENEIYDEALESRVKRFQLSVGLTPDGVVGAETWIHLNSVEATNIPTLRKVETEENG